MHNKQSAKPLTEYSLDDLERRLERCPIKVVSPRSNTVSLLVKNNGRYYCRVAVQGAPAANTSGDTLLEALLKMVFDTDAAIEIEIVDTDIFTPRQVKGAQ